MHLIVLCSYRRHFSLAIEVCGALPHPIYLFKIVFNLSENLVVLLRPPYQLSLKVLLVIT